MEQLCPYCGAPMERGFALTDPRAMLFWVGEETPKVPKGIAFRDDLVDKYHGIPLANDGLAKVTRKKHPWKWPWTVMPMYVCRACGKGVVCLEECDVPY